MSSGSGSSRSYPSPTNSSIATRRLRRIPWTGRSRIAQACSAHWDRSVVVAMARRCRPEEGREDALEPKPLRNLRLVGDDGAPAHPRSYVARVPGGSRPDPPGQHVSHPNGLSRLCRTPPPGNAAAWVAAATTLASPSWTWRPALAWPGADGVPGEESHRAGPAEGVVETRRGAETGWDISLITDAEFRRVSGVNREVGGLT